jgi:hypothetical protein
MRKSPIKIAMEKHNDNYRITQITGGITVHAHQDVLRVGDSLEEKKAIILASFYPVTVKPAK